MAIYANMCILISIPTCMRISVHMSMHISTHGGLKVSLHNRCIYLYRAALGPVLVERADLCRRVVTSPAVCFEIRLYPCTHAHTLARTHARTHACMAVWTGMECCCEVVWMGWNVVAR